MITTNKRLTDGKKVAERLGVSYARVLEMARTGILPSVRLGRQVRFDLERIEKWIEDGGQALEGGWRKEPLSE